MAWKDLSIAQRSQLMNLYRRSGITDLASMRENYDIFSSQEKTDPYLQNEHSPWFALGGNKFSGNETASQRKNYNGQAVTLEAYKEMQRQAIRDAAVKRALSRTTGVAPTINGKAAASCIYTLTDSYGNKYRVADTKQLAANPQKYGWEVSGPVSQGMEGNIYMMMDKNGIPYHANMITSYDKSGNPLVTYSAGNAGGIAQPMSREEWERSQGQTAAFQAQLTQLGRQAKKQTYNDYLTQFNIANSPEADYKKNKQIWDSPAYETYRFIGTPDDNARWTEEWNNLHGYTQLPQLDTLTTQVKMAGGGNKKKITIKASGGPKEELSRFPVSTQEDNPANIGLTAMESRISRGDATLYGELGKDYQYFRKNDTGQIFGIGPYEAERIGFNPEDKYIKDNFTKVSYSEIKKLLPKRDYIGGENYRINTVKKVPGLLNFIKDRATAYGINPNLLLHRFLKEGWVDHRVQMYNDSIDTADQKDFFSKIANAEVSGFGDVGLDDAGTNLLEGKYTLKNPNVTWESENDTNEKGRDVTSLVTKNLWDALEIKAAEMAYRQRELAKRGITGDAYVNAAYNLGLNHKDLNNKDFIEKTYSVPTYYSSGGPIHIKPSRRGTFTAAATKHGMGIQEFATHVLANKDDYSSKMIKKAVFAKNFGKKSYGGIKF